MSKCVILWHGPFLWLYKNPGMLRPILNFKGKCFATRVKEHVVFIHLIISFKRARLDKDWIVPTRLSLIMEPPLVVQAPS